MTQSPHSGGTGYLGMRAPTTIVLDPNNRYVPGSWVATFKPQDLYPQAFEVYHISLKGPSGGFDVYLDDAFYSTDDRSDRNEYDPNNAMYVRPGQTISFHFKSAAAPKPTVNIFSREPKQGVFT